MGYGPRPRECVDLLREVADVVVDGNLDRNVVEAHGDRLRELLTGYSQYALGNHHIEWLASLPKTITVGNYLVTHSHPGELTRSFHQQDVSDVALCLDGYNGLIFGHTHR